MGAEDTGESPARIEGVVHLRQVGDGYTHHKSEKCNVLHAFKLRRLDIDAGSSGASDKPLGSEAHAESSLWLSDHIGVAQITEVELTDCSGPEGLRVP